jgi:hypothetical protein
MGRRLFQRLEHGIERRGGEHVHFVDDENLEAGDGGCVLRVLQQVAHLVDLGVGGGIHFQHIDETSLVDLRASRAYAARFGGDAGLAIQCFGKDAGEGGLADAAGSREQISVMQALLLQGIGKRADDVLLADQLLKCLGAPLSRQHLITHGMYSAGMVKGKL